ncbi:hypothetical protein [Thiolapillus brandeum]|nr:hypothetical protein [Thiolapillus brandeum]
MNLSDIHFHDSVVNAVIEKTATDELCFDVEYPVDWANNGFSKAFIVFSEVSGYEIHEIPFEGPPTILDYEVLESNEDKTLIKIQTNAGYRCFSYSSVDIEWPKKYKNTIEEKFYSAKRDSLMKFVLNDYVQITKGAHAGHAGSVISVSLAEDALSYVVELESGQGEVEVKQSFLSFSENEKT